LSDSFFSQVLKGTFWVTLFRWVSVGLGTLSTVILARLLLPDDFGLVATAAIVTGFFEVFSRLGTEQYLIHKQKLTDEEINTAWTIQLISKLIIAILIFLSSYYVPVIFNEPRLGNIIKVLAIIPMFMAFNNVGLILLKKEMKFKQLMLFQGVIKILVFAVTVIIAFILKSYWAFIVGNVLNYLLTALGSYYVSNYRPKLCLTKISSQFSFSIWTLLKGIVNYVNSRMDQLLVTKYLNVSLLGELTLGKKISSLPGGLVLGPLMDVLFPGLAKSLDNSQEFASRVQKLLFIIVFITLPLTSVIILLAEPIVSLFLGDTVKWVGVVEILPLLAPILITSALAGKLFDTFTLLGKVKFLFVYELITAAVSIGALFWVFNIYESLSSLIWTKVFIGFCNAAVLLFFLRKLVDIRLSNLAANILPILILNVIFTAYVFNIIQQQYLILLPDILHILIFGVVYSFFYALSIFILCLVLKKYSREYQYLWDIIILIKTKYTDN